MGSPASPSTPAPTAPFPTTGEQSPLRSPLSICRQVTTFFGTAVDSRQRDFYAISGDIMKVLITGAGAPMGQALIRAVLHSSLQTTIVAVDADPWAAGLRWADVADWVPGPDDDQFLRRFEELLATEHPDAVFVGRGDELPILARQRQRLEAIYDTRFLLSNEAVVETTHDRWKTHHFLVDHDIGHPRCCLAGDEDELLDEVGFPLVVKPRYGSHSQKMRRANNLGQLRAAMLRRRHHELIVQEYVGDAPEEYAAGALVFGGQCRATLVMRRLVDGEVTRRASVGEFPRLQATISSIAERLGPFGPVEIQFRLDDEGLKVFEINSRFSELTFLRSLAGFNEVEMTLAHLFRDHPVTQPTITPMTILRHWSETVVHHEDRDDYIPITDDNGTVRTPLAKLSLR